MDDSVDKTMLEHAWRHFTIHADQRLKAFNFFLILATITTGALLTILKDLESTWIAVPIAFLLSTLSFVFWKLDVRTKQLIWYSEDALRFWETKFPLSDDNECPHVARVFNREDHLTRLAKKNHRFQNLSYSDCFNLIFLVFGIGGVVLGIAILCCT